ncbi:MAG TPA: histidine kinase dimerization/phosphoacceptor domain -containing protein, partial [Bacteroidia bacterium]|nr:histidine kinase dimerization/phosphoacceptor domain -containing protein [Bacteroidia bacterium]
MGVFNSLLKKISALGTQDLFSTLTNKRIILCNRLSLFAVIITLLYILMYYFIGQYAMMWIELFIAILYAFVLLFNHLGLTTWSRIYMNIIVFGQVSALTVLLGSQSNVHTLFIPCIMLPFILFEFERSRLIFTLIIANAMFSVIAYSASLNHPGYLFLSHHQLYIISQAIFYTAALCSAIVIYSILYVNEKTTRQLDKDKGTLSAQVESIFNNSVDALFLVDWTHRKIIKANKSAVDLFEAGKEETFFSKYGFDLHKTYPTGEEIAGIKEQIEKDGIYEDEILYKTFKGNEFWGSISVKAISVNGQKYQSIRVTDITEQKKIKEQTASSLKEKELLLAEIHHRVKNNLAIISALINLQVENLKDDESKAIFEETKDRIYSMALIHNQLYQNNSFAQIEFAQYINNFCSYLSKSYQTNPNVEILERTEKVFLDIKTAIPCALILNELITNAFK